MRRGRPRVEAALLFAGPNTLARAPKTGELERPRVPDAKRIALAPLNTMPPPFARDALFLKGPTRAPDAQSHLVA